MKEYELERSLLASIIYRLTRKEVVGLVDAGLFTSHRKKIVKEILFRISKQPLLDEDVLSIVADNELREEEKAEYVECISKSPLCKESFIYTQTLLQKKRLEGLG
jgi:hypothetical protein